MFGDDGRITFGYPDLRARAAVGSNLMGHAPGFTTYNQGTKWGVQERTLTLSQMPSHNHLPTFTPSGAPPVSVTVEASTSAGNKRDASPGRYLASQPTLGDKPEIYVDASGAGTTVALGGVTVSGGGGGSGTVSVQSSGSSQSFGIENPAQAVNFSICETGIYPSRN